MSARLHLRVVLILGGLIASAPAQILVPKFNASTNSLYPPTTQQEVHLVRSLLVETNSSFEHVLCRSVAADIKPAAVLSFHLLSFTFSYPSTNGCMPSQCEMAQPEELIWTAGGVSHRGGADSEVPLNYVRIVDPRKKVITAELDLLVGTAPLSEPQSVRYCRRSFRFVYRDGWIEDR